jgi:hypothetical protein
MSPGVPLAVAADAEDLTPALTLWALSAAADTAAGGPGPLAAALFAHPALPVLNEVRSGKRLPATTTTRVLTPRALSKVASYHDVASSSITIRPYKVQADIACYVIGPRHAS